LLKGVAFYADREDLAELTEDFRIILFDGIDDFRAKHPQLSSDDVQALVAAVERAFSGDGKLTIVLCARASEPGIASYAKPASLLCEVLSLSGEEAEKHYSGVKNVLAGGAGMGTERLLLSPLVLSAIGDQMGGIDPDRLRTRTAVIDAVLNAIVRKNLVDLVDELGDWNTVLKAVILTAVPYFYERSNLIKASHLVELIRARRKPWDAWQMDHPHFEMAPIIDAFRFLDSKKNTQRILDGTIFFPVIGDSYRLKHREWEDYCVGKYVADVLLQDLVRCEPAGVEGLSDRALRKAMFEYSGESLYDPFGGGSQGSDWQVTPQLLTSALSVGRKNLYTAGNFFGILGSSNAPFAKPLAAKVFQQALLVDEMARHVLFNTFGHRCLRDTQGDFYAGPIRRALSPVLREFHWARILISDKRRDSLLIQRFDE
jgi:hypothetical protein